MANIYVIDTSALISNPNVVYIPRRHGVIIPAVALRQLDSLKNSSDSNTAYWARKASQAIEQQQRKGNLLIEGSSLDVNALGNAADNEIIGTALWVSRNYVVKNVILVSTDRNMRIAAVNSGLKAEEGNGSRGEYVRGWVVGVSLCLMVLSLYSFIIGNALFKVNDDVFFLATSITFGVSLFVFMFSFFTAGNQENNRYNDDPFLDPAFSSMPGNVNHHYYKRDR